MATISKRTGRTGKITWTAKVRRGGVNKTKTFPTRAEAERWAAANEDACRWAADEAVRMDKTGG